MGRFIGSNHTSSEQVTTAPCLVHTLEAVGTGTAGSVTLKDGGSSGTTRWVSETPAVAGDSHAIPFGTRDEDGLWFSNGLYVTLSNAKANIARS